MIDVRLLRENFAETAALLATRGVAEETLQQLKTLDEERRRLIVESEQLKQGRNEVSEAIARLKREKQDATDKIADMKRVGEQIKAVDAQLADVVATIDGILAGVPNLPDVSVPHGADETENVEVRRWNEPRQFTFEPKPHWEIAENLGILDFERGAKVSGSRFLFYKGLGARLERACYNYMLDLHTEKHGYTEMVPPYIVNEASMFGTGQFPKFKEDVFQLEDERGLTLIPTAEVPLTNYHRDEILQESQLPVKFTAFSPSFRSEAGSAGRDTRGLIRLHQFHKVELVKLSHPETSFDELELMTQDAERVLQGLELPYRVLLLCTGDMGFSAAKTYDLEVWIPAQDSYREISSCSNCTDFQARRAKMRFRNEETDKVALVHTLNGSGLAVGRTVAAILENYQEEDGSVTIPRALVPYMNGIERLTKQEAL